MAIRILDMFCGMNSIMVPVLVLVLVLVDILSRLKAVNKKMKL